MLRGSAPQAPQQTFGDVMRQTGFGQTAPRPQPTPQPTPQPVQPTVQPNAVQSSGQPQSAQDLVNMGFAGYQGWGNAEAVADFKATGGQGKGGPSVTGTSGVSGISTLFNQPKIDLAGTYQNLYDSSGISKIEADLSAKSKAYTEQVAKIKDNPYLSEATMTGRLKKLDEKFNADTKNILSDIAMRKADVETRLNLQTKQFDINSQQAQQAWSQLNSLISAGALTGASGEDIASITRATGIPGSFLQSIIAKQKKDAEVKPSFQIVDDGTNQYVVAINDQGNVINKQVLAPSKPKAASGTSADDKKEKSFDEAIANGIQQLQRGEDWGTVWNRIKTKFPDVPDILIDMGLGTSWKQGGAYEQFIGRQQKAKKTKEDLFEE